MPQIATVGCPHDPLLFTIIAGVLLGGIVHLVTVLALPRIATQDAYSRLTPMTKLNAVTQLAAAEPGNAPMPFMDPAFAIAVCRYDLSGGPIKLTVPVSQAYTSVSFYTRNEVAYYAINDRSAGRRVIELDLMTEAQHAELAGGRGSHLGRPPDHRFPDRDRPDRDEGARRRARPDAAGAGHARRIELQGADRAAGSKQAEAPPPPPPARR